MSLEAEETLLGALMMMPCDSPILDEITETGLNTNDFYREQHRTIYRAALELQAERVEPTSIALTERLDRQGRLEQAGGKQRLHELAALVPATSNAPHYAKIVHELACFRGQITVAQQIMRLGYEHAGDARSVLGQASSLFDEFMASTNGSGPTSAVQVVSLDRFTSITDDQAEPLIGTPDETLLPADGMLLMYGDGGAGKTTLSIDALAHIASGTEWLGNPVPEPTRVTLIENEGPRGPFRRRLRDKVRKWQGKSFSENVAVLDEPWTKFTLTDPHYRRGIAKEIQRTKTQLVIVGPLASLGAKGTGTPDDVNEFSALIADLRTRVNQPFALWIVHHENKAGDISGAWERVPDTLVHVTAQGNGRTRLHYRKVRWSSSLHNTGATLLWADNTGFTIEQKAERDWHAEIKAFLLEHPRSPQRQVEEALDATTSVRKTLRDDAAFEYEPGPNRSKLWSVKGANTLLDSGALEAHNAPNAPNAPGSTGGASPGSLPEGETRRDAPGPECVQPSDAPTTDDPEFEVFT